MGDHTFCRKYYNSIMKDVRKKVDKKIIKGAWAYRGGNYLEFQIPGEDFVYYGDCCLSYTKAQGWLSYLKAKEGKQLTTT